MRNTPLYDHYVRMCRMRAFEEACIAGAAQREIHGELHTGIGQEAVASGLAVHLRRADALVSTHRNHLHGLAKGVDEAALMAEIFEKETGICRGRGGHMHPFDPSTNFSATGIVGASLPVALGYAYAFAMEKRDDVAVALTGDGGSNNGSFHETLNMAAAWRLPLLVVIENNDYAISVPAAAVTSPVSLADRAAAYGARGMQADGRDVEAVDRAMGEAFDHVRGGQGPCIVELACHRFRGHYEGDADTYRPREERQRMKREGDPILLAREKLIAEGVTAPELDAAQKSEADDIAGILAAVRGERQPDAAGALDHVFVQEVAR